MGNFFDDLLGGSTQQGGGTWDSDLVSSIIKGGMGLFGSYMSDKEKRQIAEQQSTQWQTQFDYQKTLDQLAQQNTLAQLGIQQQNAAANSQQTAYYGQNVANQFALGKAQNLQTAYKSYLSALADASSNALSGYHNAAQDMMAGPLSRARYQG